MDFYFILGVTIVLAAYLTKQIRRKQNHVAIRELVPIIKPVSPVSSTVGLTPAVDSSDEDTPPSSMSEVSSEDFVLDPDYIK